MIDWWQLGANALWILGLALMLASYSYHSYAAAQRRAGGVLVPGRLSTSFFVRTGLLMVTAGLGLTSDSLFQRSIWGILGVITLVELVVSLRRRQPTPLSPTVGHADDTHSDI